MRASKLDKKLFQESERRYKRLQVLKTRKEAMEKKLDLLSQQITDLQWLVDRY